MTGRAPAPSIRDVIAASADALKSRVEEVNRLNVFPVPDGDTGTNMSLTMATVAEEVAKLGADPAVADVNHAVTHGSLMGARGNSGVILSQILRGLCEGIDGATVLDGALVARALERARDVAYQAVRKPVEGTMLTVVKDAAEAAARAAQVESDAIAVLELVAKEAYLSVQRTPDLLPVLKENGVVDAGGFGLAILIEGFAAALAGHGVVMADSAETGVAQLAVEPIDDWDDDEYLYCTEFLLFGDTIDREAVHDFIASVGGSELVVGESGEFKVHVHTDDPGMVLGHVTRMGEVAEVHINNMRRQQADRDRMLRSEGPAVPRKEVGFVAVAAGDGLADILRSLGADVVVSGGQTMNPSTADLVAAVEKANADTVVILPNNKNIVLAANAAASVAPHPVFVVPTRSVPQGFAALLAYDGGEVAAAVDAMSEAASYVKTGEVTTAVKDAVGSSGPIKAGQVIGIIDDEDIAVVGDDVIDVARRLATLLTGDGAESLTILAGSDLSDADMESLAADLEPLLTGVEIEAHRGGQPLYPVIMSAE